MNAERRLFAVGNGIHDFASTIHTVASGKISWIAGAHGLRINSDAAMLQFEIGNLLQKIYLPFLAQSFYHHAHIQLKFGSRHRQETAASLWVFLTWLGANALQT